MATCTEHEYEGYLEFHGIINNALAAVQEIEPSPMLVFAEGVTDLDMPGVDAIVAVDMKFWVTRNRIASVRFAEGLLSDIEWIEVRANLALMHKYEVLQLPLRTTLPDAVRALCSELGELGERFQSVVLSHPRSATSFEPRYAFNIPGRSRYVCVGTNTGSVFESFVR